MSADRQGVIFCLWMERSPPFGPHDWVFDARPGTTPDREATSQRATAPI